MTLALVALSAVVVVGGAGWMIGTSRFGSEGSRTFYVGGNGDDRADGRSPSRPWRTLDRVSAQELRPGDRVLLEGGQEFSGQLLVGPDDAGDPGRPVEIGSYGAGRALLRAVDRSALTIHNTAGVVIGDLRVVGGPESESVDGIAVYSDLPDGSRLASVTVENVEVSGFKNGMSIGTGVAQGFEDVVIGNSSFHDNRLAGLVTYGPDFDAGDPVYANRNVTVSGVEAYDNTGDPDTAENSGSGIVLGSVDIGRVEKSTTHGNGALSSAEEGPIGIWAYNSTNLVIEENLSYENRTRGADGGGLGLDLNVSDSVVQYNLTYGNDGAGILLFARHDNGLFTRNVVRFNISVGDGRRGSFHGGLTVFGGLRGGDHTGGIVDAKVYRNTVVMRAGARRTPAPAISVGGALHGVEFLNNDLVSAGGGPSVRAVGVTTGGVAFEGNNYFGGPTQPEFSWEGVEFSGLAAWRGATEQELIDDTPVGLEADPGLSKVRPTATAADQITSEPGFRLRAGSPLIGAGVPLTGIDPGPRDFYGDPLARDPLDIGASGSPR